MIRFFTALQIVTLMFLMSACYAESWEERAAKRFKKPMSEQEKQMIIDAVPESPRVAPKQSRRVLVISRCETFIHTSIPYGMFMLEQMGKKSGAYTADFNDNYEIFSTEYLADYDVLLFNNTTSLKLTEEHQKAIFDFLAKGKGIVGIHAATDNFQNWHEGICMMGGVFNGHPWNANGTWAFKLDDAKHPLNAIFGGKGFWHTDEIYQYKPDSFQGTENLRILVSLDMTKEANIKPLYKVKKKQRDLTPEEKDQVRKTAPDNGAAVSWLREFQGGRIFYTNFGHREDTNWNPKINQHILDGIQYALGDLEADATPTAKMSDLIIARAPEKPE